MSLIDLLSILIYQASYDDLPESVIDSAKVRILDFLGAALTGFKHEIHYPLLKVRGSPAQSGESTKGSG